MEKPDETVTEASVRSQVSAWLDEHWDPDLSLLEWRRLFVDAGWAKPSWTRQWHGRDLPAWSDAVVRSEFRAHGAVYNAPGGGVTLASPTIFNDGSDQLKERFLRPTLTGEIAWTQLFSEPGNGSDLPGSPPPRPETATSGSSMARRSGAPAPTTPIWRSSLRAVTGTHPSIGASRTS